MANALLAAVILVASRELPGVINFGDVYSVGALFGAVFAVGVLMTTISTARSVNKYLGLRTADLYV